MTPTKLLGLKILIVESLCSTADECFLLGRLSYNEKDLYHTILWMQEALDIDKATPAHSPANRTVARAEILDYLSYALAVVSCRSDLLFLWRLHVP